MNIFQYFQSMPTLVVWGVCTFIFLPLYASFSTDFQNLRECLTTQNSSCSSQHSMNNHALIELDRLIKKRKSKITTFSEEKIQPLLDSIPYNFTCLEVSNKETICSASHSNMQSLRSHLHKQHNAPPAIRNLYCFFCFCQFKYNTTLLYHAQKCTEKIQLPPAEKSIKRQKTQHTITTPPIIAFEELSSVSHIVANTQLLPIRPETLILYHNPILQPTENLPIFERMLSDPATVSTLNIYLKSIDSSKL